LLRQLRRFLQTDLGGAPNHPGPALRKQGFAARATRIAWRYTTGVELVETSGVIVQSGTAKEMLASDEVQKAYLGMWSV
jgi:hypothetical protein